MAIPLTQPNQDLADKINRTIPGMAHWSGTGPKGMTCGSCQYFVTISRGMGVSTRCEKYSQMMSGRISPKKLPPGTFACKYFKKSTKPDKK